MNKIIELKTLREGYPPKGAKIYTLDFIFKNKIDNNDNFKP